MVVLRVTLCVLFFAHSAILSAHPGGVDENGCHFDSKTNRQHCHNKYDTSKVSRIGDEGVFFGPIISVQDGDSFKAKVQGVVMEFRLAGIDAPEHDQPYGTEARRELLSLLNRKQGVFRPIDTDRYGRTVVFVWVGEQYINREMVKRGAAWFNSQYATDDSLFNVETETRAAKRGLWALSLKDRVEPWVWRQERR